MEKNFKNYPTSQYENLKSAEANSGVTFVYRRVDRDGVTHKSAFLFYGSAFTPENGTQDEVFRVWKNIIATYWTVKAVEQGLKKDNGGIATKLRAGVPSEIIVRTADGKITKSWNVADSVWSRIGLVPTARDLEESAKDFKKKIHKATKASFDALSFRLNFADFVEEAPTAETAEKPEKQAKKSDKKAM